MQARSLFINLIDLIALFRLLIPIWQALMTIDRSVCF